MSKQIIPFLAIGMLIISGFSAGAVLGYQQKTEITLTETATLTLGEPIIKKTDQYVTVDLDGASSLLLDEGKPILPVITKTYTFPIGTVINDVHVTSTTKMYTLPSKIQPSPKPVILSPQFSSAAAVEITPDETVYMSSDLYPSESYTVRIGVGLNGDERVIYVNVHCYPQYSPAQDIIYMPEDISIDIEYTPPKTALLTADEYDMLIITDKKFASQLQPLVDHKNNIGVRTILETTDQIYPYYDGRDEAEDIKLRIKDAIEEWGIKYVLLAGGRKGQTFDWYIPERRTNNDDGSGYETGYASDLYYADIYKYENGQIVFEDWDSNGNGVFAEFSSFGWNVDEIDYYPDVYVGRIPLRYSWEPDVIVNKIITYENSADDSWFKHAYVIAGDTSPPARDTHGMIKEGVYEGELSTNITANLLEDIGFTVERLWTSTGTFSNKDDVVNAVSAGSGFIHFAGHGNPAEWVNFLPDAQTEQDKAYGFNVLHMRLYTNGFKLPVVIIGGCHNGQFNVTMQILLEGLLEQGAAFFYHDFWYMEWVPTDSCSWFVLEDGGGAIATIGNTGLGYGYINEFCTEGLGGWINPRFFQAYAVQHKEILGETHGQAIIDYLNMIFGVLAPNNEDVDRKTIEEWVLIGDPSLHIGGL